MRRRLLPATARREAAGRRYRDVHYGLLRRPRGGVGHRSTPTGRQRGEPVVRIQPTELPEDLPVRNNLVGANGCGALALGSELLVRSAPKGLAPAEGQRVARASRSGTSPLGL